MARLTAGATYLEAVLKRLVNTPSPSGYTDNEVRVCCGPGENPEPGTRCINDEKKGGDPKMSVNTTINSNP